MPIERFSALFWLAVAVLASRVLLELGRGLMAVLNRAADRLASPLGRARVILVAPAGPLPEPLASEKPTAHAASAPAPPRAPVLLESLSHEEMDRLLEPRG